MAAMEMRMQYDSHNPFASLQRMQTAPIPVSASAAAGLSTPNLADGGRRPSSHNIVSTGGGNTKMKTQSANMSGHAGNNSLVNSQAHTSSNYSMQSAGGTLSGQSSRSSDTTQGTATSTLFPPPIPPASSMPGGGGGMLKEGEVTATDNIMNTVADAKSSLFQICVTLQSRLHGVPGVAHILYETEESADEDTDPVTILWRTFKKGDPFMYLYNLLHPDHPLTVAANMKEEKRAKAMTFKFLQACINELKFPQEECFIVSDLYGSDSTSGFVKVAKVVNRVLDVLEQRGLIEDRRPTASDFEQAEKGMKRTQRQHIVSELVTTERTYVQHLELLQLFKNLVEERGTVLGDAVHDIFFNLTHLLDFQRRFLIRVEQTNQLPEEEQNWGKLFVLYRDAFLVYEAYIANQRKCEKTVVAQFDNLVAATSNASTEMKQMVESPTNLYGFLMKPFQRLSKYPLLLDDLYKKGDLDEERKADLLYGREAATSVLASTNAAVDREEKAEAVKELEHRVEDWKGHRVSMFGALLLYGTFTVLKGENLGGGGKEGERVYHVYLFETILLCCKDIDASKPKNKLSNKQLVDKRGKPKLQLKGRIFMSNITDLISLAKPGSYTCQIFWTGDPSIENFIIRFTTEEMMKKWAQQIEAQRRKYRDRSVRGSDGSRSLGTSTTEFEFMRNQTGLENPYAAYQDEEDEEDDDVETLVGSGVGVAVGGVKDLEMSSRNSSFASLRSRGESISSAASRPGQPSSRYPQGHQPSLSLRTRDMMQQSGNSPESIPPESYFSPIDGSPSTINSSRTSASSGMYGAFPQPLGQQLRAGQNGTPVGFYEDGSAQYQYQSNSSRFTAPAVARQREPSVVSIQQQPPAGPPGRAAPPRPGMHSATQMPGYPRHRSASSPDIHNQPRPATAQPLGTLLQGQPPIPDMPAPYQMNPALVPRSQSNSPSLNMSLANGVAVPSRGQNNVSPQANRERGSRGNYPQSQQLQGGGVVGRAITPTSMPGQAFSPPPTQALPVPPSAAPRPPSIETMPTAHPSSQLKVKVHCPQASQTLTLVVPLNISCQSLKDRIDAKLQRSTSLTLSERVSGKGDQQVVKLKFADEGDFVSIQSDEDVQTAFETWQGAGGGMAEVELFCQR